MATAQRVTHPAEPSNHRTQRRRKLEPPRHPSLACASHRHRFGQRHGVDVLTSKTETFS